jgi:hypothetical protein
MKSKNFLFLFLILVIPVTGKSQNKDTKLTNAYVFTHSIDISGKTITSINMTDFSFRIISFLDNVKGEVYVKIQSGGYTKMMDRSYFVIHSEESYPMIYEIDDSILTIHFLKDSYQFKIVEKTEDRLILKEEGNIYFLTRIVNIKGNYLVLAGDTLATNETLHLHGYNRSRYKGDLLALFKKNLSENVMRDTSYQVEIEFLLRGNGSIDSIKVNSDSNTNQAVKDILLITNNKWEVKKIKGTEMDSKMTLFLYIKSNKLKSFNKKAPTEYMKSLFQRGYDANNSNEVEKALSYFEDCERYFDCYENLFIHSKSSDSYYAEMVPIWINSIMNQAAILYKKGNKALACEKWKKIVSYDKDAAALFNSKCNN